jgi:hypothetical protein
MSDQNLASPTASPAPPSIPGPSPTPAPQGPSARQMRADVSPKYLLRHPSYLGGQYLPAGEIVDWGGEPHANMEPINPAAEERLTAWREALPPAMHGPGDFPWRTTIGGRAGG